jgi:hypothetical protein
MSGPRLERVRASILFRRFPFTNADFVNEVITRLRSSGFPVVGSDRSTALQ